jgi:hypothetical protein
MKPMKGKAEQQNPQDSNNQSDSALLSRRGFLRTGAALGAAMCITPAWGNPVAGQAPIPNQNSTSSPLISQRRKLGSGKHSLEVSALGFGCMGMNYHLMWREPEKEVLPVCEELGIGFVPYSPVNRGFLGGNLNEYTRFDSGNDNRNTLPRFTPVAMRANLAIVEVLNRFGRTRGATSAQVAMAWLLAKKPWIVPIPGTTKLAHLEENLRTADLLLTAEEMSELEGAVSKIEIIGARYPAEQQEQISRE